MTSTYTFTATVTEAASGENTSWSQPFTVSGAKHTMGVNSAQWGTVAADITGMTSAIGYVALEAYTGTPWTGVTVAGSGSNFVATGTQPPVGTPGVLSGTLPGGFTAGTEYWVLTSSSSGFTLATAMNSTAIPPTSGTAGCTFTPYTGTPSTFPGTGAGLPFNSGISVPVLDTATVPALVNAGLLDTALTSLISSMPNGSWLMPHHEVNLNADLRRFGYSSDDVNRMDRHILQLKNSLNPTIQYGRGFSAYDVFAQGQNITAYATPGMDFYGVDGYQKFNANLTTDTVFGVVMGQILDSEPNARIEIIETNTQYDVPTWFNDVWSYVQNHDYIGGFQSFWGDGSSLWSSSYASTFQAILDDMAAGE